jgi:hypothetical protein
VVDVASFCAGPPGQHAASTARNAQNSRFFLSDAPAYNLLDVAHSQKHQVRNGTAYQRATRPWNDLPKRCVRRSRHRPGDAREDCRGLEKRAVILTIRPGPLSMLTFGPPLLV